ncbi:precorrin-3B synthase [Mesorhizobium sp. CGMCC 1.15528]|uniref:Precorrin-3B synthase n=1 Tax=Mesorhizobium zhangyense TaxID=1776730 RepID=A0A7C9VBJ7_9HYPH|nr:precorrin-3B synthase [Mesorhizobium zhangyense]
MNAFSRRGACPALSAPMQTGDGLLVRLNPVAGGLAPKALIGLCESASRHGNGVMEVTARGSLQIRGLTAESAVALAGEVNTLGIAVRTGVPVETGPLAGLDPQEIANPSPLANRIREAIDASNLGGRLGSKVSVLVDGGGRLNMDRVQADVRLTAVSANVWQLAVAGDAKSATVLGEISGREACDAALIILRMIAAGGREARARDLNGEQLKCIIPSIGLHPTLPPSVLPDISPTGGEISSGDAGSSPSSLEIGESFDAGPISPPVGEMSGRTEGGNVERLPGLISMRQEPDSPIGVLPLRNTIALGLGLPFGHMRAESLIALCHEAESLGVTEIRLAQQRALLLLGLSQSACITLQDHAKSLGFITDPLDPRRFIAACPGTPACASGLLHTRDIASQLAEASADLLDGSFELHVSGCAKGCAHPAPAALTLVGGEKGAGLVVDGTAKDLPAGYTSGYEAARALGRVARLVRASRKNKETTASCLSRLGAARIAEAFEQG